MLCEIMKEQKRNRKIKGPIQVDEEEREVRKIKFKFFMPLNPIPLQVISLRKAGYQCKIEKVDIEQVIPKLVIKKAIMVATAHARDNPSYPIRGVN